MLGEEEKIMGYEGLQVIIYLSSKRLVPYVEVHWQSKAPVFTKIDDLIGKITKHYGVIFTCKNEFTQKVLNLEKSYELPGDVFPCQSLEAKQLQMRQVCLSDQTYSE